MSGIQVHVKVRPHLQSVWATADTVIYSTTKQDTRYMFNRVHGVATTNESLFHEIEPCVHSAFDGKNVTVMAYGQTGSGKTHSMTGAQNDPGVIARVAKLLMDLQAGHQNTQITVSYVEIYNESVRDLMSVDKREANLRDGPDNTIIFDRNELLVTSFEDFRKLSEKAEKSRQYGVTDMNEHSSRSHIILTFEISRLGRKSTISLVDLAGSESASRANTDGQLLREGGFINRSLLALGNVVDAIVDNRSHIPYRESKLTRILRNCLGGNGLTFIICCLNPTRENFDQTVSSLRFAQRAMKIRNDPTISVAAIPSIIHQHLDWIQRKRQEHSNNLAEMYSTGVAAAYDACRGTVQNVMVHRNEQLDESQNLVERMGKIYMLRERRIAFQQLAQMRDDVANADAQCTHNTSLAEAALKRCRQTEDDYIAEKDKRMKKEPLLTNIKVECNKAKKESAAKLKETLSTQVSDEDILFYEESSSRMLIQRDFNLDLQDVLKWFADSLPHVNDDESQQPLNELLKEYEKEKELTANMEIAYEMVRGDFAPGVEEEDTSTQQPMAFGGDTLVVENQLEALHQEEEELRERHRHQAREAFGGSKVDKSVTPVAQRHPGRTYGQAYESPYSQKNIQHARHTQRVTANPKPTSKVTSSPVPKSAQLKKINLTENVSKLNNAKELLKGVRERMTFTGANAKGTQPPVEKNLFSRK